MSQQDSTTDSQKSGCIGGQDTEKSAVVDKQVVRDDDTKASVASEQRFPWFSNVLVALLALLLGILTPPLLSSVHDTNRAVPVPVARDLIEEDAVAPSSSPQQKNTDAAPTIQFPCTEENLAQFRHERHVHGYDIVCFLPDEDNDDLVRLRFYRGGARTMSESDDPLPRSVAWSQLEPIFQTKLALPEYNPESFQPWVVFSPNGERLVEQAAPSDETLAMHYGMVLVYEGGQFLWPGVRVGFTRTIDLYSIMPIGSPSFDDKKNRTATLETLSLVPLVLAVEGFLSDEECQYIQELAEKVVEYSEVVLMDKDAGRPASDFRTSRSGFLDPDGDDVLVDIDYRTASLIRVPRSHQEHVQVLRYGPTEKYNSHHDFFNPSLYKNDPETLSFTLNGRRNRFATVFWYLSDVAKGGETIFPALNGRRVSDHTDCTQGLKVQPQQGKVIIFYSMTADGRLDKSSLHGACPVQEGIKWAANKWIWNEKLPFFAS